MDLIMKLLTILMVAFPSVCILYRVYVNARVKCSEGTTTTESHSLPTKEESIKVFLIAILFRLVILLISIIIYFMFVNISREWKITDVTNHWILWDANNYIRISNGYDFYMEGEYYSTLVFFPLYPFLTRVVDFLVHNIAISGLIVSTFCYAIGCVFLYRLVSIDYGKSIAQKALILLSVFPFSFFFSSIMSESTFFLFSVLTLYYTRKHRWCLTGLFGFFAALSRAIGVFLMIPAFIELVEEYHLLAKIRDMKYLLKIGLKKIMPLLLIPSGILVYLYCNYLVTNDWFYFLKMQSIIWQQEYRPFYHYFVLLWNTLGQHDMDFQCAVLIPEILIGLFSYFLLIRNAKKSRTMYSVWLLIYILVNTSLSWPLSVGRYFTCAIPLFIYLADNLEKHPKTYQGLLTIFSILFGIFFVSYFMGRNIY